MLLQAYDKAEVPREAVSSLQVSVLIALRALRCLCSLAKGLQAPTEEIENLDSDEEHEKSPKFPNLDQLHANIMVCLRGAL